jgi:hypothetical protein
VVRGVIGRGPRRERTAIGQAVNLASRLAEHAARGIVVDAVTRAAARGRVELHPLPPLKLRGRGEPVMAFQALAGRTSTRPHGASIGRDAERAELFARLDDLVAGRGGTLIIEGEAGIGKTRLAEDLLSRADELGVGTAVGTGDPIATGAPYHAWRTVVDHLLALGEVTDDRRHRVMVELGRIGKAELAPLLSPLLELELDDNELTRNLTGAVRADNTNDVLVALLGAAAGRRPLVIVLDDAQWLDSASAALAGRIARQLERVLVVMLTRPGGGPTGGEPGEEDERIVLGPLGRDDAAELARRQLGVAALPEPVAGYLFGKAEGHPFFSEELVHVLRESGLVSVAGDAIEHSASPSELAFAHLPDSVHGVVTARLERLPPRARLVLEVASVLGRHFAVRDLVAIHPRAADRREVEEELGRLEARLLIVPVAAAGEPAWLFKHSIIHEVAYALTPAAQRTALHAAAAALYDSRRGEETVDLALLAHHWEAAGDATRARRYLDDAGAHALRAGAAREAIELFERAARLGDDDDRLRQARREEMRAAARYAVGELGAFDDHIAGCLALVDRPVPRHHRGWLGALVAGLVRRAVSSPGWASGDRRARLEVAARAWQRFAERLYFERRRLAMVAAALRAANLADRVGAARELARAHAFLGIVWELARLPAMARKSFRHAFEVAEVTNDLAAAAFAWQVRGVSRIGFGDWATVEDALGRAVAGFERLGDRQELRITRTVQGLGLYYTGRFRAGHRLFAALYDSARSDANRQHEGWGLYAMAECLLPFGATDQVVELLERATAALGDTLDHPSELICFGLLAAARARRGERVAARRAAAFALDRLRADRQTVFSTLEGYAGAAEALITLARAGGDEAADLDRMARGALRRFARFAQVFPIGRARLALLRGRRLAGRGAVGRAAAAWRRGLRWAERCAMPYEAALLHHELSAVGGVAERRRHQERADQGFGQLECTPPWPPAAAEPGGNP